MNRREFLVGTAAGLVGGFYSNPTERHTEQRAKVMTRKNFIWSGLMGTANATATRQHYRELKEHGIDGVFLDGVDDHEFDIIKGVGLDIHAWMWTTNRREEWIRKNHPDWYMVSRTGKSCFDKPPYVDYYRWISPVIPGVQRYLEDRVADLAKHPAVTGVHLDYVRYPDIILPKALWKDYKLDQTEELPEYDFCYSEHTRKAFKKVSGRDPLEIKDPSHDQEWLHFRQDSVTKLVKKLAAVAHDHDKQITAAVFPTPSMARKICRQDWDKWPLDLAAPMIYHSFYEEKAEWIGDAMRENLQAATFPIVAGLYMPAMASPDEFRTSLTVAYRRGAAGVSLFGGVSEENWKVFESVVLATR